MRLRPKPKKGIIDLDFRPGCWRVIKDFPISRSCYRPAIQLCRSQVRPREQTVDKQTGCITSLYDKKTKFETLAAGACGNQLQTFKDLPKEYDAWNIDPGTLDHFTPIGMPIRSSDCEGPAAGRDSRDAHLAELEVRPGHYA